MTIQTNYSPNSKFSSQARLARLENAVFNRPELCAIEQAWIDADEIPATATKSQQKIWHDFQLMMASVPECGPTPQSPPQTESRPQSTPTHKLDGITLKSAGDFEMLNGQRPRTELANLTDDVAKVFTNAPPAPNFFF